MVFFDLPHAQRKLFLLVIVVAIDSTLWSGVRIHTTEMILCGPENEGIIKFPKFLFT